MGYYLCCDEKDSFAINDALKGYQGLGGDYIGTEMDDGYLFTADNSTFDTIVDIKIENPTYAASRLSDMFYSDFSSCGSYDTEKYRENLCGQAEDARDEIIELTGRYPLKLYDNIEQRFITPDRFRDKVYEDIDRVIDTAKTECADEISESRYDKEEDYDR